MLMAENRRFNGLSKHEHAFKIGKVDSLLQSLHNIY